MERVCDRQIVDFHGATRRVRPHVTAAVSPRCLSAMTPALYSLHTEMEAFTFAVTTQVDLPIRIKM